MRISVHQLNPSNLFQAVEHDKMLVFLRNYMRVLNPWVVGFWFANLTVIAFGIFCFVSDDNLSIEDTLSNVALGIFLFIVILLPIHEVIHGVTYKIMGAPAVSYKASFRQLVFYALADGFVANRREFFLVAIMPFAVISLLLLTGMYLLSGPVNAVLYGSLLIHTGGCYVDFALISFFYEHRNISLVTVDDVSGKKTYFYRYDAEK